jgi:hypothetical protein
LMKAAGISGVGPRKRWKTTIRIAGITPATDLVERQFRLIASTERLDMSSLCDLCGSWARGWQLAWSRDPRHWARRGVLSAASMSISSWLTCAA